MLERKRQFTRHPLELRVRVRMPGGWTELSTLDVSRQGVFLRTDKPLEERRVAQIRIAMPGGRELDAMGRVRRVVRDADRDGDIGMGIEFFVMADDAKNEWDAFVLDHSRRMARSDVVEYSRDKVEAASAPDAANQTQSNAAALQDLWSLEVPLPRETVEAALPAARTQTVPVAAERDDTGRSAAGGHTKTEELPLSSLTLDDELPPIPEPPEQPNPPSMRVASGWPLPAMNVALGPALPPVDVDALSIFITVRPGDLDQLREFVDRRLRMAGVFLRYSAECSPGQPVDIALIHPDSDCEVLVSGKVARVVRGETPEECGFLLRFDPLESDSEVNLHHFVDTGHHDVQAPTAVGGSKVDILRRVAEEHPDSSEASLTYAWALLATASHAREAVEAFLRALVVAPDVAEAHEGLAMAYALAGETAKAYAFLRSGRQLREDLSA